MSKHANNTLIVVSSDHLAMRNTASSLLNKLDRKNLFFILPPNIIDAQIIEKRGSMLDVAPTVMHSMGLSGDIGLGRNLLSSENSLSYDIKNINSALNGWRHTLMDFWGFPRVSGTDQIHIDSNNHTLTLQNRAFKYPLLIEFGNDNDTIIRFKLHRDRVKLTKHRLVDYMSTMKSNKPFLWVDLCKDIRPGILSQNNNYCVMYGRAGNTNHIFSSIHETMSISVDNIFDGLPI
jgi:phosphoglycerol transferase